MTGFRCECAFLQHSKTIIFLPLFRVLSALATKVTKKNACIGGTSTLIVKTLNITTPSLSKTTQFDKMPGIFISNVVLMNVTNKSIVQNAVWQDVVIMRVVALA